MRLTRRDVVVLLLGLGAFVAAAVLTGDEVEGFLLLVFFGTPVAGAWLAWKLGAPARLARRRRELGQCVRCGHDLPWDDAATCRTCGADVAESRGLRLGFPVMPHAARASEPPEGENFSR